MSRANHFRLAVFTAIALTAGIAAATDFPAICSSGLGKSVAVWFANSWFSMICADMRTSARVCL